MNKKHEIYDTSWQNDIPKYEPKRWNIPLIKKSHNCYSYFLNKASAKNINECVKLNNIHKKNNRKTVKRKLHKYNQECGKPQPGYYKGKHLKNRNKFTCKRL